MTVAVFMALSTTTTTTTSDDDDDDDDNNNDNIRVQRRNSRLLTISSLRPERSPTRTL